MFSGRVARIIHHYFDRRRGHTAKLMYNDTFRFQFPERTYYTIKGKNVIKSTGGNFEMTQEQKKLFNAAEEKLRRLDEFLKETEGDHYHQHIIITSPSES